MASIKKNFGYNLILTFCNYLFPIITFPYISRVLGVENIGICNYIDSIINYFAMFSIMGIGSLGVREIARCKDNLEERAKVFSNLLFINILLTFISIVFLCFCIFYVKQFFSYRDFLFVGIAKLVMMPFLVEWFFQGMQEFKYITIRSVLIRFFYIVSLFVFVHSKEDVFVYYILLALQTIVNAAINLSYSKKFVSFKIKEFSPFLYFIPIFVFGYYRILTSLYTTFNVFFLGFTSGNMEVGYFSTATKLNSLILSVFTAFTTVMVPKVSEMLNEGKEYELRRIADKTFCILITVAFPVIIYCWFNAPMIIRIIAGDGYDGAIIPFRIIIFLILIIGIEQVVIQQFLMACRSNKSIAIVSTVGAFVGIFLNCILTPKYRSVGSAVSWGCSELSVMLVGLFLLRKYMGLMIPVRFFIKSFVCAILYVLALVTLSLFNVSSYIYVFSSLFVVIILFIIINFKLTPNPVFMSYFQLLKKRKS